MVRASGAAPPAREKGARRVAFSLEGPTQIGPRAVEIYVPSFCTGAAAWPRRSWLSQKVCTCSTARPNGPEHLRCTQPRRPHPTHPWQPSLKQGLLLDFMLCMPAGPGITYSSCKHGRPRDAASDGWRQAGELPRDGCRCVEACGAAGRVAKRRGSGRARRFACLGARKVLQELLGWMLCAM